MSCRLIGRFEPVADHFVDDFGVSAIIDADGRDLFKPRQARAQAVETHDVKVGEHASDVHDEIVKPLENFVSDHVVVTEKVAVTGGDLFVQKSRIVAGNVEFYHFGVRFERNKLVVERGIAAVTVLVIVRNIDVFLARMELAEVSRDKATTRIVVGVYIIDIPALRNDATAGEKKLRSHEPVPAAREGEKHHKHDGGLCERAYDTTENRHIARAVALRAVHNVHFSVADQKPEIVF